MARGLGKVARKYARALLDSYDVRELDAVRTALNKLSTLWQENAELRQSLLNPGSDFNNRAQVLSDISALLRGNAAVKDRAFANFLQIIFENQRLNIIPELAIIFSELVDEVHKQLQIELTSAFDLSEEERQGITHKIKADFGQLAQISWKVDRGIVGGLLIKSGDRLIDSSVRGALDLYRAELVN